MITTIEAVPIHGDIHRDLAIISSLGEHLRGQYVLVRVHDSDGRVGLGEASVTSVWSGETQAGTIALIEQVLAPIVIGADPFDLEWIGRQMDRAAFGNSFAKAAIEMALLDLQGQALGVPIYKLLGGMAIRERERSEDPGIRLKFVVGAVEAELAAQRALRMVKQGWKSIKVKIGRHEHPRIDIERLHAVRDAIGADTWLSVDANGGYTVEQAVWVAPRLEKLNVALFEQPTRRGDHAAMAEVRRRSGIPIMADESVFTPQDALEVIRHHAADVLSLYPGKHGGIRVTQHIAKLAEAAGIPCTIGSNLEREVATAAMAHVTACTANIHCERFPGDLIGPIYYEKPLSIKPLRYQADRLWVPQGAGLGVTV
ncbi:MAG: mandelate racemase/muconate lactonizing protein [Planctomycetes bacterium]|nr:mandelate racemase/muconate lactonizing protein [Planctomycetota bacterium]